MPSEKDIKWVDPFETVHFHETTGSLIEYLQTLPSDTPISKVFEFGFGKRGTVWPIDMFMRDGTDRKLYFEIVVDEWKLPPDLHDEFMRWISCRGWIADKLSDGEAIYGKDFYDKVKRALEVRNAS